MRFTFNQNITNDKPTLFLVEFLAGKLALLEGIHVGWDDQPSRWHRILLGQK